mgnify:FL=1
MKGRAALLMSVVLAAFAFGAFSATAASNGTYKGETPGGLDVLVKVKDGKVVKFDGDVYTSIGITSFVFPPSGQKGKKIRIKPNGTFRAVFQASPGEFSWKDDKRTVTGKFKGGRVTGSMKVEGLISGEETYSAKR